MKKILIIDTTFPVNTRTSRFIKTLSTFLDVFVCAWDRGDYSGNVPDNFAILKSKLGYGNRIKKLFSLPLFIFHSYKVAKKNKPEIIFASHWDSLICAVFIKIFLNLRIFIIYDCLDMPTSSRKSISILLRLIERFNLKFVSLVIFASRHFKPLYPKYCVSYIFENYPSRNIVENKNINPKWFDGHDLNVIKSRKNIAWIGVVRYFEVLDNILNSIVDLDLYFFVFGDGPELGRLKRRATELGVSNKVIFFGRYDSVDLSFIYELSDVVWAAYPTEDFNAIYAISNKYFECSYFCKVPIFSKNTKMAKDLAGNRGVFLVNEYSVSEIKDVILKAINFSNTDFLKYEIDSLWEEKEVEFVTCLKEIL